MRYQFVGTVKVFNNRYWITHEVRTKASKLQLAAKTVIEQTLKTHYKGKRISQVICALERLGAIVDVGPVETDQ